MVAVLLVLVVYTFQLVRIQGLDASGMAEEAAQQATVHVKLPASRGDIVDADGVVLATSLERYAITANQKQVAEFRRTEESKVVAEGPGGAAALMAPILGLSEAELAAKLTGDRGFVYVVKDVTPEVRQQIRELKIPGISSERTELRTYPQDNVAGNIVGFVGKDGTPLAGVELSQRDALAGTDGYRVYERGAGGQQIPSGEESQVDAEDGRTIHLTIDRDLQWEAQQAIDAKVAEVGAEWGAVVAIDVKTGELLALADSNSVNPNDFGATEYKQSHAVSSVFEPGSTGKVITMCAAVETGVANPLSQYVVDYTYTTPNGQTFKDSHEHGRLNLTLTGILSESSNSGTVQVGEAIPKQVRYDYLKKFGFGTRTGVEIPGESGGLLGTADSWDGRTQYSVLFGQGVAVNALQATSVFAAVANGGVAMPVHVVKGTSEDSGSLKPNDVGEGARVVSAETAATVLKMLESAVDGGTGSRAGVPGYRVAGKTGTSQIADGQGGLTANVSSFIGVAPVDDPRIAIGVIIYKPTSGYYGGDLAAPVFSDVAGYTLQHLGIPPSGATPDLYPTTY